MKLGVVDVFRGEPGSQLNGEIELLSYRIDHTPVNGVLGGTPPTLIYTPNIGFDGEDSLTFIASDGQVDSAIGVVRLLVAHHSSSRRFCHRADQLGLVRRLRYSQLSSTTQGLWLKGAALL